MVCSFVDSKLIQLYSHFELSGAVQFLNIFMISYSPINKVLGQETGNTLGMLITKVINSGE